LENGRFPDGRTKLALDPEKPPEIPSGNHFLVSKTSSVFSAGGGQGLVFDLDRRLEIPWWGEDQRRAGSGLRPFLGNLVVCQALGA
jgi:hypothetical protein